MTNIFGTASRKLRRNTDPQTSHDAANAVDTTKLEQLVYEVIKASGQHGCTADDVAAACPQHRWNTLNPRCAPLIRKGLIYRNGDKRRGQRMQLVMRANRRVEDESISFPDRRKNENKKEAADRTIKYLKDNGMICPYCSSDELEAEEISFHSEGINQNINCPGCNSTWIDHYKLTKVSWDK